MPSSTKDIISHVILKVSERGKRSSLELKPMDSSFKTFLDFSAQKSGIMSSNLKLNFIATTEPESPLTLSVKYYHDVNLESETPPKLTSETNHSMELENKPLSTYIPGITGNGYVFTFDLLGYLSFDRDFDLTDNPNVQKRNYMFEFNVEDLEGYNVSYYLLIKRTKDKRW